jgi:hypothetical protein
MREHVQARLEALRSEWATAQAKLRELELQQLRLREVLLRLRGAIQVLEELLQSARPAGPAPERSSPETEPSEGSQYGSGQAPETG